MLGSLLFATVTALVAPRQEHASNVSGGPLLPEQAAYDVRFYDLELAVDPARRSIRGTLSARADVRSELSSFVLDLDPALAVDAVRSGKTELSFERRGGRVWIDLAGRRSAGDVVELSVDYGGVPREAPRPPWDGGFTWARTADGSPWIATSCQGQGADLWWPCKDHPSDEPDEMALHVTVPEPLVVASNGRLVSVDDGPDGTRTWHWFVSTPINTYGVALQIAPYRTVQTVHRSVDGSVFPVVFWALPESEAAARAFLPEILDHLRFFEERFGPYPFRADKYGVAQTPHLGMEHQTVIAYGYDFGQHDKWGYDWLHHHELSHEWWGNLVTNADWKDMWLHEGFGTYTQHLYVEEKHGPAAYFESLADSRGSLRNRKPVAGERSLTSAEVYFSSDGGYDNDIYYKGAWILHTLRWVVGDAAFFRALRRMAYPDPALELVTDGRQCRTVTTEDFIDVAEAAAGRELDWFFDVYLRQADLPRLVTEVEGGALALAWQVPGDLTFPMPVEVELAGETVRVEVPVTGARVRLAPGSAEPRIDPRGWILRLDE